MTLLHISLLAVLVIMFVVATKWPINIGIMGFIAAFTAGIFALGMDDKEILAKFPATIVVTIIGVTFFFSLAQKNGTVDLMVRCGISLVRGRSAIIPWVFFFIGSGLTALGTFSPAAVALMAPAALTFSAATGYSAVAMGALVIGGAGAGSFSPLSVQGVLIADIAAENGVEISPVGLFIASYAVNFVFCVLTVTVLRVLGRLHIEPDNCAEVGELLTPAPVTGRQKYTLALIGLMIVAAVGFGLPIGYVGLTCGLLLAFSMLGERETFVSGISWSTVLLVSGMMVYISLLTQAGVIETLSQAAVGLGIPLLVALLLCYVIGVGSAFASSTALLTAFIPLAIPLLGESSLGATGLIAAIAVSGTIVDVSPFSTDGALVVSNARGKAKQTIWKGMLTYAGCVVLVAPALAWALLVPTGVA